MSDLKDIISSFREGNVFLHGPGGTGKSYTIAKIMHAFRGQRINCTASTGIAAVNLNTEDFKATTLHKWTGLQLCEKPVAECVDIIMKKFPLKRAWQTTRYLIIDEVSMISGLFFEKLNSIAQIVRGNFMPFGGIHVLVSGDFLQLPPVEGGWIFLTKAWKEMEFKIFNFTEPKRYPDLRWFQLLSRCREGKLNKEDLLELGKRVDAYKDYTNTFKAPEISKQELLRLQGAEDPEIKCSMCLTSEDKPFANCGCKCFMHTECLFGWLLKCAGNLRRKCPMCKAPFSEEFSNAVDPSDDVKDFKVKPTILYSTRREVDELNDYESARIPNRIFRITSLDNYYDIKTNVSKKEKQPIFNDVIPDTLCLKVGSQVMLKWNVDTDSGLANGTRGVIVSFETINVVNGELPDTISANLFASDLACASYQIKVKWYNGLTTIVEPQKWVIEDEYCRRSRTQIPLVLAWALTIHKSQGCTMDYVICDLGSSVFAPGQAYVALSRVKTLEGLLISQIDYACLFNQDPKALEFVKNN